MKTVIVEHPVPSLHAACVEVWACMDESEPADSESFIIGLGATREDAIKDAVREMQKECDRLLREEPA